MANHYRFECPVLGEAVMLEHCEAVHSASMQGRPQEIENKICALAHQSWMCPARNAFRVGGPWSHYETKPFSAEPMERPAKLPRDLVVYALSHTTPTDRDYRRCGMWGDEVGMHDALFEKLQASVAGQSATRPSIAGAERNRRTRTHRGAVAAATSRSRAGSRKGAKSAAGPETAADAIGAHADDMARAVTELARQEAAQSASQGAKSVETTPDSKKAKPATQKRPARSQGTSGRKMSLAERAKLMKQRRKA